MSQKGLRGVRLTNTKSLAVAISDMRRVLFGVALAGTLAASWLVAAPAASAGPLAPSGLTATVVNAHRIDLSWVNNAPNVIRFHIESAANAAFQHDSTYFTDDIWQPSATGYSDTSVYPGATFYYRVYAVDSTGVSSASNVASAYVPASASSGPAAPTALAAAAASATQIDLSWQDNSPDEAGFTLERAGDLAFTQSVVSITLGANARAYSDQTVIEGPAYYYRVRSFDSTGPSAWSNTVLATTAGLNAAPAAPGSLTVTSASASAVSLSWVDNSSNETGFRVERAGDAGFSGHVASFTLAASVSSYTDVSVAPSTTYYYRVIAFDGAGDSAPSNVASCITSGVAPPSSDIVLTAFAAGPTMIALSWSTTRGVDGFRLDRASDPAFVSSLASFQLNASVSGYVDVSVEPGATYYYRVFALNSGGLSPASNTVVAIAQWLFAMPAPPSGLVALAVSPYQINLKWSDNSTDEAAFEIERAADSGFTSSVIRIQVPVDATSYGDVGVSPGTTYYYRVRAMGETGRSAPSNTAVATTLGGSGTGGQ